MGRSWADTFYGHGDIMGKKGLEGLSRRASSIGGPAVPAPTAARFFYFSLPPPAQHPCLHAYGGQWSEQRLLTSLTPRPPDLWQIEPLHIPSSFHPAAAQHHQASNSKHARRHSRRDDRSSALLLQFFCEFPLCALQLNLRPIRKPAEQSKASNRDSHGAQDHHRPVDPVGRLCAARARLRAHHGAGRGLAPRRHHVGLWIPQGRGEKSPNWNWKLGLED